MATVTSLRATPITPITDRSAESASGAAGPAKLAYAVGHGAPQGARLVDGEVRHQIAHGETFASIAQAWSQAFHLPITASDIAAANPRVPANDMRSSSSANPDPELVIPRVNELLDARVAQAGPDLVQVDGQLRHQVKPGQTLGVIASSYRDQFGVDVTWQDIAAANPGTISDPNVISPRMQPLVIPGISTESAPADVAGISGRVVARELLLGERGEGTLRSSVVLRSSRHAEYAGITFDGALAQAREAVNSGRLDLAAVVQASDGSYWVSRADRRMGGGEANPPVGATVFVERSRPELKATVEAAGPDQLREHVWDTAVGA